MKIFIFSFCLIATSILFVSAGPGNYKKRDCDFKTTNEIIDWFYFFQSKRRAPDSSWAMNHFCEEANEKMTTIKQFTRCAAGAPRQQAHLLQTGIQSFIDSACGSQRDAIIKAARCFERVRWKGERCMERLISDLDTIKKMPSNLRISGKFAFACCAFNRMEECLKQATGERCSNERNGKIVQDMFHQISHRLITYACYDVDLDKKRKECKEKLPKDFHSLKSEKRENHTVLVGMIDILKSLT